MTTVDTNDNELAIVEASYMELAARFTESGVSPMISAAVMAKLALMMYKSSLSAEEYNNMVDMISESRNAILTLEEYAVASSAGASGRLN